MKGELELASLNFCFPSGHQVLDNASILIPAGSKVGVVGETGIGKSTLLDLIQGYLVPDTGAILLDGQDISDFDPAAWRACIAVVPQDPVIFRDTLAANIRYMSPQADDKALSRVIEQARLTELVGRLPGGLSQVLSERGVNLSGGEKQRIALARALLKDPVLVLMDEPTSAVDAAMEAELISEVEQLFIGVTRIFVSHRQAVFKDVDLLIRLDESGLSVAGNGPRDS